MKKYNCSLIYQNGMAVDVKDVTFKKKNLEDFKLGKNAEKVYKLLKNSLDRVEFIARLLTINGANVILGVGGDVPHKELVSHVGFWKIEGKNVLPLSYFKVVSIKVIAKEEKEERSREKITQKPKKLGNLELNQKVK